MAIPLAAIIPQVARFLVVNSGSILKWGGLSYVATKISEVFNTDVRFNESQERQVSAILNNNYIGENEKVKLLEKVLDQSNENGFGDISNILQWGLVLIIVFAVLFIILQRK